MTHPIRALIFDMDGLLVNSEPLAARAMADFLACYGHQPRPEVAESLLGRRLPEAIAIVREAYGLTPSVDELTRVYGEMRLAALQGSVQPMPGAREIIALGRQLGLRLALATSGTREHVDVSLGETGLAAQFDVEVTGDDVRRGKPAPDLFLLAAQKLGVPPANCVVLEDAPLGVEAAKAAGMRVIAVPNERTSSLPFPVPPDITVPNLIAAIPWLLSQAIDRPVQAPVVSSLDDSRRTAP